MSVLTFGSIYHCTRYRLFLIWNSKLPFHVLPPPHTHLSQRSRKQSKDGKEGRQQCPRVEDSQRANRIVTRARACVGEGEGH